MIIDVGPDHIRRYRFECEGTIIGQTIYMTPEQARRMLMELAARDNSVDLRVG